MWWETLHSPSHDPRPVLFAINLWRSFWQGVWPWCKSFSFQCESACWNASNRGYELCSPSLFSMLSLSIIYLQRISVHYIFPLTCKTCMSCDHSYTRHCPVHRPYIPLIDEMIVGEEMFIPETGHGKTGPSKKAETWRCKRPIQYREIYIYRCSMPQIPSQTAVYVCVFATIASPSKPAWTSSGATSWWQKLLRFQEVKASKSLPLSCLPHRAPSTGLNVPNFRCNEHNSRSDKFLWGIFLVIPSKGNNYKKLPSMVIYFRMTAQSIETLHAQRTVVNRCLGKQVPSRLQIRNHCEQAQSHCRTDSKLKNTM